jgi:hypothetical protein
MHRHAAKNVSGELTITPYLWTPRLVQCSDWGDNSKRILACLMVWMSGVL